MEDRVSDKLIRQLRSQVNELSSAVQLLTPLVTERGRDADIDYLAIINKDLYQLIRTIYHLELCENKDHPFFPELTDVADLCRKLGREVESVAEKMEVSFTWRLDKEDVLTMADQGLLRLAVLNMLTNAFQAAGKGGRVVLRCGVAGGEVKIAVTDNGEGLELSGEDDNPLLKSDGGLGLGVESARKIAALHGGRLMLSSATESGVYSVLSLPIRKPDKSEAIRQGLPIDHMGGYSPLLVEFSPLLGSESFLPEDIE